MSFASHTIRNRPGELKPVGKEACGDGENRTMEVGKSGLENDLGGEP